MIIKGERNIDGKLYINENNSTILSIPNPDKLEISNIKLQISNKLQIPNTNDMKHY